MSKRLVEKQEQAENILRHGLALQRLYPATRDRAPVTLCKQLHRIEARAARYTLQLCNGPELSEADQERIEAGILASVKRVLGTAGPAVILNRDPRGYALKIETEDAKSLDIHKDWGGYGIICPEF